jgi:hypothetical protein
MNSSCFVADVAVSSGLVVWDEHRPKPGLSAHHAVRGSGWSQFRCPSQRNGWEKCYSRLVGLFGLFQRILLNVTLDTLIKRELDRLERVPECQNWREVRIAECRER